MDLLNNIIDDISDIGRGSINFFFYYKYRILKFLAHAGIIIFLTSALSVIMVVFVYKFLGPYIHYHTVMNIAIEKFNMAKKTHQMQHIYFHHFGHDRDINKMLWHNAATIESAEEEIREGKKHWFYDLDHIKEEHIKTLDDLLFLVPQRQADIDDYLKKICKNRLPKIKNGKIVQEIQPSERK